MATPRKHDPAKVAAGIGMIQAGTAERVASELTGIPRSTLHDSYQRFLGPNAPNKDEARKATDERLLATAYCASEQLLTRMADEAGEADHKTVTSWAEVSLRAVGRLRGWDRGITGDAPTDRFAAVIERVLNQGGATLSVSLQPNTQMQPLAIDLEDAQSSTDDE